MKGWIPGLCLVLAAGSQAFASSQSQRAHGTAVFAANGCGHCHSINKVGGHKGPDLSGVGRKMSKSKIREQILHGGNEMPSFTDDLQADEVNDLVAYLRSCRQKPIKK
jgi:mono/diheme cytochrome c family protein